MMSEFVVVFVFVLHVNVVGGFVKGSSKFRVYDDDDDDGWTAISRTTVQPHQT